MTRPLHNGAQPRHPTTGRFLAHDCEVDCLEHCAGPCGVFSVITDARPQPLESGLKNSEGGAASTALPRGPVPSREEPSE